MTFDHFQVILREYHFSDVEIQQIWALTSNRDYAREEDVRLVASMTRQAMDAAFLARPTSSTVH